MHKTLVKFIAFSLLLAVSPALHAGNPAVKLGIVADIQYDNEVVEVKTPSHRDIRHYSEGVSRLSEAITTFNGIKDLSFVASLGDMTDRNPSCYVDLKAETDKLNVPFYNVMGNHDLKPLKTAEEIEQARKLKGLDKTYYSFVRGGIRFIVLDCMDYGLRSHPEGSARLEQSKQWFEDLTTIGAKNAEKWNGGIGLEQLNWLEKELCKADRKGQYAIVLCHMILYPFDARESLWNNMEVVHLIEGHPSVKAVFCGHNHRGGYAVRNGIHYVNFKGMVETDSNRYAVVTIDTAAKKIIIDGYGDELSRDLDCR